MSGARTDDDGSVPDARPRDEQPPGFDGDRRDRAAAQRDEVADRADRAAEERDHLAEQVDGSLVTTDVEVWRIRSAVARRAARLDRLRAADDRDAARSDRLAAANARHHSAICDLTGAFRRDAGMVEVARDFERARRTGQSMVIGFLDVDGLKAVNDNYGHAAGDAVLRRVAVAVHTKLGRGDNLVRYGGDEFVFSVLGLGLDAVRERLEQIEEDLRADGTGSISCGIALATGAATVDEVISDADADLYRRRREVRDEDEHAAEPRSIARYQGRALHVADEFDRPQLPIDVDATVQSILTDPMSVRPMFQPIVDLDDGAVVGYEALARWPGYPVVDPTVVFAAAAERGALTELDRSCRAAAVNRALDADLTQGHSLFLNVEAGSDVAAEHIRARLKATSGRPDVVLEFTERSLLADPAMLLATVDRARAAGYRIALDDVGSHPDTLTLLDFVAPDFVKLDRVLVQQDLTPARARIISAISAHVESTGAVLLAEGIETEAHLDRARAYGATLGQGWMYGRPAPLPDRGELKFVRRAGSSRLRRETIGLPPDQVPATPADVFDCALPMIGRKSMLASITHEIERRASRTEEPLTVLATFQDARFFTPPVAQRFARLAAVNPFVAVLGPGISSEPAPGVRGTNLEPNEPLVQQWIVAVVGEHYFAAVIARDLGDTCADEDRRFEFLHTYDRNIVVAAARSLMQRVIPPPAARAALVPMP